MKIDYTHGDRPDDVMTIETPVPLEDFVSWGDTVKVFRPDGTLRATYAPHVPAPTRLTVERRTPKVGDTVLKADGTGVVRADWPAHELGWVVVS